MNLVRTLMAVMTWTIVTATAQGRSVDCIDGNRCTPSKLAAIPAWTVTGSLNVARQGHTMTLLADGKVLVIGGMGPQGPLDSVELYDPATGAWTIAGRLQYTRFQHTATLLNDGRVLVVGGFVDWFKSGGHWWYEPYEQEVIYDPRTGESVGPLGITINNGGHRDSHTATMLESGRVFVVGGWDWNWDAASTSLMYDARATDVRQIAGPAGGRVGHQATLLLDGRVLITGGQRWDDTIRNTAPQAIAETFEPDAGEWNRVGNLAVARVNHTATRLVDGKVLVVGGGSGGAELFDPATSLWQPAGTIGGDRHLHTASLLRSGSVLIAGGSDQNIASGSVKAYVVNGEWIDMSDLNFARWGHTAAVLRDGRVLVAGGYGRDGTLLASAEVLQYDVATPPSTVIEYRNTQDFPDSPGGHFFYSDDPAEIALLDAGKAGQFTRTGRQFKSGGSHRLCRFFGSVTPGPNSHFYTISDDECEALKAKQQSPPPPAVQQWNYEGLRFAATPPIVSANGASCPAGTVPVYRGYNNAYATDGAKRAWDSVHRYSVNRTDIEQMVAAFGWRDEGIAFCARQ